MKPLVISGGGPAGSSAAIAALHAGADVAIIERARFPRHKVCGEFLSPEIVPTLDRLGVLGSFLDHAPFRVRRMELHFGRRTKRATLPEVAYGLSRYAFDDLLLSHACANGARIIETGEPQIVATGRGSRAGRDRLFGFKAHFDGPVDDAVELYFFEGSYVGLNCVEGGRTNVCGLAPERLLRQSNFDIDDFMQRSEALRTRLSPLRRSMKWLHVGPLDFRQNWTRDDVYLAGDALSFVDPFTGSGLLSAVISGALAGQHAAAGKPVAEHARVCRNVLEEPFAFSSALRRVASTRWAEWLVGIVSGETLFRLTRPAVR